MFTQKDTTDAEGAESPEPSNLLPGETLGDGFKRFLGDETGDPPGMLHDDGMVSAVVYCVGVVRDESSGGWGKLITFKDKDGVEKRVVILDKEIHENRGAELVKRLADLGLYIATGKLTSLFLEMLNTLSSTNRVTHVTKPGFVAGGDIFVSPVGPALYANDEARNKQPVVVYSQRPDGMTSEPKGTLEGWKNGIAVAARKKGDGYEAPHVVCSVLHGLSGPVMYLLGLHDSIGLGWFGQTSTGKTTNGVAQISTFDGPKGGLMIEARATDNGLEAKIPRGNHTTICINDAENNDVDGFIQKVVYMLANQSGKARANQRGDERAVRRWEDIAFSLNAERDMQQLKGRFQELTAGTGVRLVPLDMSRIPLMSPEDYDAMFGAITNNYAHAGPALVAYVYAIGVETARAKLRLWYDEKHREIAENATPAVARMYRVFALHYAAGMLAKEAGILPENVDVTGVVKWIIENATADGAGVDPGKKAVKRLLEWAVSDPAVCPLYQRTEGANRHCIAWTVVEKDSKGLRRALYLPADKVVDIKGLGVSSSALRVALEKEDLLIKPSGKGWQHDRIRGMGKIQHYRVVLPMADSDGEITAFEVAQQELSTATEAAEIWHQQEKQLAVAEKGLSTPDHDGERALCMKAYSMSQLQ